MTSRKPTFHPFPLLPPELRLMIWELLLEPRIIDIRAKYSPRKVFEYYRTTASRYAAGPLTGFDPQGPSGASELRVRHGHGRCCRRLRWIHHGYSPVLVHINSEARAFASRHYSRHKIKSSNLLSDMNEMVGYRYIWINAEKDIIIDKWTWPILPQHCIHPLPGMTKAMRMLLTWFRCQLAPETQQKLQNILLYWEPIQFIAVLCGLSSTYPSLKRIYILTDIGHWKDAYGAAYELQNVTGEERNERIASCLKPTLCSLATNKGGLMGQEQYEVVHSVQNDPVNWVTCSYVSSITNEIETLKLEWVLVRPAYLCPEAL